jgi:hypothetical protein
VLARSVPPLARVSSLALLLRPLRLPRTALLLLAQTLLTHHLLLLRRIR